MMTLATQERLAASPCALADRRSAAGTTSLSTWC